MATAICSAIILAKLSVIPVRRGYWGNKIGKPHTVLCKVTENCGSVTVRMVPAPRGFRIVAVRVPRRSCNLQGLMMYLLLLEDPPFLWKFHTDLLAKPTAKALSSWRMKGSSLIFTISWHLCSPFFSINQQTACTQFQIN
ncbi:hypothetical protein S83_008260 [Arachis hypogaea]|nr:40S ribosomal protein [Arachis hypogaea]